MCKDGDYFLDVNIQVTACQFHEFRSFCIMNLNPQRNESLVRNCCGVKSVIFASDKNW